MGRVFIKFEPFPPKISLFHHHCGSQYEALLMLKNLLVYFRRYFSAQLTSLNLFDGGTWRCHDEPPVISSSMSFGILLNCAPSPPFIYETL